MNVFSVINYNNIVRRRHRRLNYPVCLLGLVLVCGGEISFTLRDVVCFFVELVVFLQFIDFDSLLFDWNWLSVGTW